MMTHRLNRAKHELAKLLNHAGKINTSLVIFVCVLALGAVAVPLWQVTAQQALPFSLPGAVTMVSNGEDELRMEDDTVVNGTDEAGGDNVAGLVWQGSAVDVDIRDDALLVGVPPQRPFDAVNDDAVFGNPTQLTALVTQWAALPGVVTITGQPPATLGTQGNPQITVWQASGLEVASPFTGYGLLIITGEIDLESDFEFHGLIVMTSNNRLRIKDGSTQEVHGGLIAVHESATEIRLEDDANILYNSSDLATFVAPLIATGGNTAPVADAGPDKTVQVTDTVQLDGSDSTDVDGDLLTFSWTILAQPAGSSATLDDPTAVMPTFVADAPGSYEIELIVNDGTVDSDPDTVTITTINSPPVADAGPDQTVFVTQNVLLDGTNSSDVDQDPLTFLWSFVSIPAGSTATLSDATTSTPNFTVDLPGTYEVRLIVNDGTEDSAADTVVINTQNSQPVANAEPDQTVPIGSTVQLDGSNSNDVDGDPLTFLWALIAMPAGSTAVLSDATLVNPTFVADLPGIYVVQLIVNDGNEDSDPATVTITTSNTPPVAEAGPDQTVPVGTTVNLDGSASSDAENDPLTFAWTITSQPAGSTVSLSDPTIVNPTFVPVVSGSYVVELIVNDGTNDSDPDSVLITVQPPILSITNFTPTSVAIGEQVTITGQGFISTSGGSSQVTLAQQGGGTIGATITSANETTIVFTVPTGAATGAITVTVDGQSDTSDLLTIIASNTYSLTVEPSTADVLQGQSVAYAISMDSTNGFTQLAPLAVTGLPAGVTAEFSPPQITAGQTVVLTVTAPSGQILETATLAVSASATVEGVDLTETTNVSLTVQPVTTSFLGRTVVANTLQIPLAGVTVTMLGGDGNGNATGCTGQTVSDLAGNFALTNLSLDCVGPQLIRYDGSTAIAPPGVYAGVDLIYTIVVDQVTVSPVLVHLPRIDDAETLMVQQNHPTDQILTFQSIPNLTATVYAGTIFTLLDGTQPNPFPLTAIQVPVDRLPEEMTPTPDTVDPFIVAFQPANAMASQPVAVSFPNLLDTPPVTTGITLSTLDPTQGTMVAYGTGTVSEDGLQVIPDLDPANPGKRFGLVHFDWHGPDQNPPGENPGPGANPPEDGDPVDLSSGILVVRKTDLEIKGGRGRIGIDRNYRTLSTAQGPFGIGTNHNYGHRLAVVFPTIRAITLIMPKGNRFAFSRRANDTFTNTSIPALRGAVLTLVGGDVDLRWKDGTVFHFVPGNFFLGSVLESITDRNGNQTTLVRNPARPAQIIEVIDPVGRKLTVSYDGSDRITSIIDPIGRAVEYTYNTQGTLETITDPEGGVTRYDYDSQNRMTQITDARSIVFLQNTFDADGRVVKQIDANGAEWIFAYQLLNPLVPLSPVQQTTVTDPRGNQTISRFNPQGFLISQVDALGQTTLFERENGTNFLLSITDPLGRTTRITYDAFGNIASLVDPDDNSMSVSYDPTFSRIVSVKNALNQETILGIDSRGNLISETNHLGDVSIVSYDSFGQPVNISDPLSNTNILEYDAIGDLINVTNPLGNTVTRTYDAISRLTKVTDPNGFSVDYTLDKLNRATQVTDSRNEITEFAYEANGNLLSILDALGNTTSFTYDLMDRLATRTDGLGRQETFDYDLNGNLTEVVDRKSQLTSFTYDVLNRRERVDFADGSFKSFLYDSVGRPIVVEDSLSGLINFDYDNVGRVFKEVSPTGAIEYEYDSLDRRTAMQVSGQLPVSYTYDAQSRITRVEQGLHDVSLTYDQAGRRTALTHSNGTSTTYNYDFDSQLINVTHNGAVGTIEDFTYGYDAAGQRTSIDRLNEVATNLPVSLQANFDSSNQQISLNAVNLSYDNNGNLISDGSVSYTWDARDRLIELSGAGVTANFTYDAFDRRIRKTINGVTTTYLYDDDELTMESAEPNLTVFYLRNHQTIDEPFLRLSGSLVETYHLDGLRSVIDLTDSNGMKKATYTYDPFGNTSVTGVTENVFQFTGRENDGTGLYYYRARYYAPGIQRFISEDPLGFSAGDINLYTYVRNSPVNLTDPGGLFVAPGAPPPGCGPQGGRKDSPDFFQQLDCASNFLPGGGIAGAFGRGVRAASQGTKLLGKNPRVTQSGTKTDLPGGRQTAKSIFRNRTRGQQVTPDDLQNGGLRRQAADGTQIRFNPDGSTRLDLPGRGAGSSGIETVHFSP